MSVKSVKDLMRRLAAKVAAQAIILFARFITAVRAIWLEIGPTSEQSVYFANHASNGDFILVWSVLPPRQRRTTRPVAAADYWLNNRLRKFIGEDVFHAVLIDRRPEMRSEDPVAQMGEALDQGQSLILFPEGTRNTGDAPLLPFKSGLYHLARLQPDVNLVPVWIENLNRVMPKGEIVPVPILCTVTFGAPLRLAEGEEKAPFLDRASEALLALKPKRDPE
jgi:1-acyl-sn-glycerol-3-phosphate acyltransferase